MFGQIRTRYPGAQPFMDDALSRKLFYGREQESTALAHQILANRLVVLFARSGLGKTSLLNAGAVDKLRAELYLPLVVRVNDSDQGPLAAIYRGIEEICARQTIEYIPGDKTSLWHFFKSAQFWSKDILLTPVLILDQFEELFTLNSVQQRRVFLDQFSCLARGVRPKEFDAPAALAGESCSGYSDSAPMIKIVISLREDFLAQLEEISDRVPEILDQRFRLLPLGREAAAQALDAPAGIDDPTLVTRPFKIDPMAKGAILDFLERRVSASNKRSTNNIEPFQLQLICQHVEEIAQNAQRKGAQDTVTVGITEIGGKSKLGKILKEFYKRQVAAVPSFLQRRGARKLCSEFLINPQGRRLRMEESEIQRHTRVKPQTLQILVDRRLLRRDQTADGDYYELSHDSLVIPIVDSRRFSFLIRTALMLVLVLIGGIIATPFVWTLASIKNLDSAGFAVLALVVPFLWLIVRWGIRNFRECIEMWRRFRIE